MIAAEIEQELFAYIHGVIQNNGCKLIIMNGTSNHVHLLISLAKTFEIANWSGISNERVLFG